ncbi:hypothetical protein IVB27_37175 [Bradyrhizobium sp. 197]|uniref:hypothetical protein n=1 Tax=Bradyrhizobium sp. 197 TaxID=2782663 RepID=UPI001FFB2FA1|nr:hypothetical protein [Bradyrhizobium sp. 197]MCK1480218.1 hypothetical protein [Bradyrhizobium sp. 197]
MTEETIKTVERGLLTGMSFTQLTTPVDGRRSTISSLQARTLKLTRPDVNERWAMAARNPATIRSFKNVQSSAPMLERQIKLPSDFVRNNIPLYVYQNGDYEWLYGLTPRYLDQEKRQDIVGNLVIELMERRVDRAGLPACAKRMIAAYNKENPMKAYGDIRAPLPLDAPAYLDEPCRASRLSRRASGRELRRSRWRPAGSRWRALFSLTERSHANLGAGLL